MEENKTLFVVLKPDAEKTKIILNNIIIMLGNRIYIDKAGNKQPLLNPETTYKTIEDRGDHTFIIKADNDEKYAIKIVYQKISAIGKQSIVNEFFKDYDSYKKIIIAREYNNKIAEYVSKHHTQIFKESSLLQDIIKHSNQPKFELLSPKEMEKVKSDYNATDYTIKKMFRSEPVSKYYALKRGDIIRIIRPSPTSGEVCDHRIVM